ncbi:hypothetical protein AI20_12590 [Aeromonas hydrophila YL17]|nr:hypothetical protein AI20_12590 [Aeromonas hydrophila YL17]
MAVQLHRMHEMQCRGLIALDWVPVPGATGSDACLPDMYSLAGFVCSSLIFKEIQVDFQRRLR